MAKRKGPSRASKSDSPKRSKREDDSGSENPLVEEPVAKNEAPASSPRPLSGDKPQTTIDDDTEDSGFVGESVPDEVARNRWPHRYRGEEKETSNTPKMKDETEENFQAKRHFEQAQVDGTMFKIGDDAHVMAGEGEDSYICRVVEMFEGVDGSPYFTAQWFYRAKDTVIKNCSDLIDDKRVFLSEVKNDNPLDCLLEKLRIVQFTLNVDLDTKNAALLDCHYYYDMMYLLPYSSFVALPPEDVEGGTQSESTISSEDDVIATAGCSPNQEHKRSEMTLLDLYSGCGGMSTGLCLGANISGVDLVTKWAVDFNSHACDSLRLNHPETEVRNETAEDFLSLLKEWEKLCASYSLIGSNDSEQQHIFPKSTTDEGDSDNEANDDDELDPEEFEVEQILSIRYCEPKESAKSGLQLKIRWKGYGPDEDTWEPIEGLGDCEGKIKEFAMHGYNSKILPLPGDVDVVCGGPPCQGISGFNRFRNTKNPLQDPKNKQLLVFMDIVEYLRPKFVLMENVVDILKFANGFLGRYGLGRLVGMNYQARMGMLAAGAYGLPQFRMRMFMWGACHTQKLPQYPLPTHNVVVRGNIPVEFQLNGVAYEEGINVDLERELFLGDAISDLPPVENDETRDEMPYVDAPETEFQKFIRLRKDEMLGFLASGSELLSHVLFDHRPLQLNEDDYQRTCQIPKRKGANYRDLHGVRVGDNNKAELDPNVERAYLPSKKPLVPDYALSFVHGTSLKPFGRLWWDETVPTVVTRAEPHNQVILHPLQDRVLTIRENARLQGFPDYYKLNGPIKERYIQVGNAVAVPVARALGYSLGLAYKGLCNEGPLLSLPKKFPNILEHPDVEEII
ncbi:hypothetical protein LguiB_024663 [Lonicera macranthoides]